MKCNYWCSFGVKDKQRWKTTIDVCAGFSPAFDDKKVILGISVQWIFKMIIKAFDIFKIQVYLDYFYNGYSLLECCWLTGEN